MIKVEINLKNNHISTLHIEGHSLIFPISTEARSIKDFFDFSNLKKDEKDKNIGSIPCAAVSVLVKSFVESIMVYARQRKGNIDDYIIINTNKEGELAIDLIEPDNDPLHVHRYAIEQMLVIGIQAVAKEYSNDIKLSIETNK